MTTRTKETGQRRPEKAAAQAFGDPLKGGESMFSQAADMLKSDRMADRLQGMGVLLGLVLDGKDSKAKAELRSKCRKAIASEELDERKAVRKLLGTLALDTNCEEAKAILRADYLQTIHDLDVDAMVFLGTHGGDGISKEADAALEANFDRIQGRESLDALAYIAGLSTCSLEVRTRAAILAAKFENRVGNLAFIRDTCDEPTIKDIMVQALSERGVRDTDGPEETEDPESEEGQDADMADMVRDGLYVGNGQAIAREEEGEDAADPEETESEDEEEDPEMKELDFGYEGK